MTLQESNEIADAINARNARLARRAESAVWLSLGIAVGVPALMLAFGYLLRGGL